MDIEKFAEYTGLSYNELVAKMLELKEKHALLKSQTTDAWNELCDLTDKVIPSKMEAENIQNITVILPTGEKKQLRVLDQVSVKTPPEKKGDLWAWLREHEAEHLITETVNASSLGGYVREQMRLGDDWPSEICDINTYSRASLHKA